MKYFIGLNIYLQKSYDCSGVNNFKKQQFIPNWFYLCRYAMVCTMNSFFGSDIPTIDESELRMDSLG